VCVGGQAALRIDSFEWVQKQLGHAETPVRAAKTGGRVSRHGRALSSAAASESRLSSPPGRPAICVPIGNPSSTCSGTLIAGWPVRLYCTVNGARRNTSGAVGQGCATLGEEEALADGRYDGLLVTSPVVTDSDIARLSASLTGLRLSRRKPACRP